MTSVVIHYKELALKGKNRPWFIQLLVRNIKGALAGLHVAAVRSITGRIELELRPDTPWDEVRDRLRRVFGIANFLGAGFPAVASAAAFLVVVFVGLIFIVCGDVPGLRRWRIEELRGL